MKRLKIPILFCAALMIMVALAFFVTPITQAEGYDELAPVTAITTTAPTQTAEQATGQAIFTAGTMGETAHDIAPTMATKPYTLHKAVLVNKNILGHDQGQYAEKQDTFLLNAMNTPATSPRPGQSSG
ncbi:MAG: hypothetical protein Q8R12_01755 [bacterium]|nr:hypothetical protein [bacterium]